ncbi:MAG: NACHT domain-containing protein [Crocosphaera sp.]|nr:NACHT domain-containing protein [Crocosphaera sp.]
MKRLLKRRRDRYLLLKIVTLALILIISFSSTLGSNSQTPPSTLNDVKKEIKELAARDVEDDISRRTDYPIRLYGGGKTTGISDRQIGDIYDTEYTKQSQAKKNNFREWLKPTNGWIPFIILFFVAIFQERLKQYINRLGNQFDQWISTLFAGRQFFQKKALKRYNEALIDKYKIVPVPFRPKQPLEMDEVYIPLKVQGDDIRKQIDAYQAILEYPKLVIIGDPGSGKSLLMKWIALNYAENKLNLPGKVVVLLELHRLNDLSLSIEEQLIEILKRNHFPKANQFVQQALKNGQLILLFDGLDEVNGANRSQIVQSIKDFLDTYEQCQWVITCRTRAYQNEFDTLSDRTLEVVEFSDQEVQQFLQSWKMPPEKSVDQLIQTLRDRPRIMELARNPLLLTIIAYLYADTPFILPYSRGEFYEKATDILLEKWDEQKGLVNSYKARDKRLILRHLALYIQDSAKERDKDSRNIKYETLLAQVKAVLPKLNLDPEKDATPILDEIVQRSKLLQPIDHSHEWYQFPHLTLQEFFAAGQLLDKAEELIERFKTDKNTWREVVKLWCGLSGDSTTLIEEIYAVDKVTAFECLADAQKIDPQLANTIINHFKTQLATLSGKDKDAVEKAFGAVAADTRARGQAIFEFLEEILTVSGNHNSRPMAANALSLSNLPKAAQTLAQYYRSLPEVRQPLIRMGDLAVSALGNLASTGSVRAFDDLLVIKTPLAAKVLVPLLWNNNTRVALLAAWRLAALLPLPNVEETLRNYQLTPLQKQADILEWVWEPFTEYEPNNSSLPIIAGRIAKLLTESSADMAPKSSIRLDSRLIIPLCFIELLSEIDIEWFVILQSATTVEKLSQSLANLVQTILKSESETTTEIVKESTVYSNFMIVKATEKLLKQRSTPKTNSIKEQFIDQCLKEARNLPDLWQSLFNRLELTLRLELFYRFLTQFPEVVPSRKDWRNIFRPLKFEFRNSWHYRIILTLFAIISLVTLTQMVLIILNSSLLMSWTNVVIMIATLAIIFCWILPFFYVYNSVYIPKWDNADQIVLYFFIGIIILIVCIRNLFKDPFSVNFLNINSFDFESFALLPYVVWFPVIVYFTSIFLSAFLSWQFIVLVWLIFFASGYVLLRDAKRRERAANNPLQGILKPQKDSVLGQQK